MNRESARLRDEGMRSSQGMPSGETKKGPKQKKSVTSKELQSRRGKVRSETKLLTIVACLAACACPTILPEMHLGFSVIAFGVCISVSRNLDAVFNDPLVRSCMMGGFGAPAFSPQDLSRGYSMGAMVVYVIFVVLTAVIVWQVLSHRRTLSKCDSDDQKKERANERYRKHLHLLKVQKDFAAEESDNDSAEESGRGPSRAHGKLPGNSSGSNSGAEARISMPRREVSPSQPRMNTFMAPSGASPSAASASGSVAARNQGGVMSLGSFVNTGGRPNSIMKRPSAPTTPSPVAAGPKTSGLQPPLFRNTVVTPRSGLAAKSHSLSDIPTRNTPTRSRARSKSSGRQRKSRTASEKSDSDSSSITAGSVSSSSVSTESRGNRSGSRSNRSTLLPAKNSKKNSTRGTPTRAAQHSAGRGAALQRGMGSLW